MSNDNPFKGTEPVRIGRIGAAEVSSCGSQITTKGDKMKFDCIVLTAANEAQAAGYRVQLDWRRRNGLIPAATDYLVLSDPGGRRVGSLGATVNALAVLREQYEGGLSGKRILICHSGGDSRRTPAYAAQGKVFTPVPCASPSGVPLALFDLILRTCEALPAPEDGHVLVVSGDVLLTFDHAPADFSRAGMTGVAYFDTAETGSRHGVYVPSSFTPHPSRTVCAPVANFLQKPTEEAARTAGAMNLQGLEAVDTGILSLRHDFCGQLLKAVGRGLLSDIRKGESPSLDVYEELCMALTPGIGEADFVNRCVVSRGLGAKHAARMRRFRAALRNQPFHVNIVPYCSFFHIGSSAELLNGFAGLSRTAQTYGFRNRAGSFVATKGESESAFLFNANITAPFTSKGRSLVESVDARAAEIVLEGGNLLTGLPPEATVPVKLPRDTGLVCLPIGRSGWAAIIYGIHDTFKASAETCTFLNEPLLPRLESSGAKKTWLPGYAKDGLWRARLWRVGSLDDVLREALSFANGAPLPSGTNRRSFAELIPLTDHKRLLAVRAEIRRQVALADAPNQMQSDSRYSAASLRSEINTREEALDVAARLAPLFDDKDPLVRARAHAFAASVLGKPPAKEAFAAVAEAVAVDFKPIEELKPAAILHDQVVWVTTPVRFDLAGGWSDTPPICSELGGAVLNAAVTLNGLYPIQVMAKLNTEGCIRLSSIDLGERKELRSAAEVLDHRDPHDWGALAKAALVLSGIAPSDPTVSLAKRLDALGGGLDLTIFSALPKGSGMGTSSILGAAVIACLDRVLGIPFDRDRIIRMTSILEQRMCTGGGWQDQVGGLAPGIKLIRTDPGPGQMVSLRWCDASPLEDGDFKRRCLLYFTGQKRMARNILQNVVTRYLERDAETLCIIEKLKAGALRAKEALDARDVETFASCVADYWELKKQLDPGSTNIPIERLLTSVRHETSAALLPGAGGGGFIFFIAKSPEAAERIRAFLAKHPLNANARFFDFAIDRKGLSVTVL